MVNKLPSIPNNKHANDDRDNHFDSKCGFSFFLLRISCIKIYPVMMHVKKATAEVENPIQLL